MTLFNARRTQPFIITLFMAIMAFKRVCKMMRKRVAVMKKRTHSHQLSLFRRQVKRSNHDVIEAARGRDVIQPSFIQSQMNAERNPQPKQSATTHEPKPVRKISTQKKVSRYLDDYAVKVRLGKGAPATVDRLMKSLVITEPPKPTMQSKSGLLKRKSTMIASALKAASEAAKPTDFSNSKDPHKSDKEGHGHGHNHGHTSTANGTATSAAAGNTAGGKGDGKEEEEGAGGADEELGYEPGTHIYFGATIALQVSLCVNMRK